MSDPLSVACSIAGLISIGTQVLICLSALRSAVREAPESINAVSTEVSSLCTLLTQLESMMRSPPPTAIPPQVLQNLCDVLDNCTAVKLEFLGILRPYAAKIKERGGRGSGFTGLWSRFKWVLVAEKDIEKVRRSLEAHKSTLGLTLMFMSNLTANKVLATTDSVGVEVIRILESMGILSDDVWDIRDRICELTEALKSQPPVLATADGAGASTHLMLRRYLESAVSYVDSTSYVETASEYSSSLAEYRAERAASVRESYIPSLPSRGRTPFKDTGKPSSTNRSRSPSPLTVEYDPHIPTAVMPSRGLTPFEDTGKHITNRSRSPSPLTVEYDPHVPTTVMPSRGLTPFKDTGKHITNHSRSPSAFAAEYDPPAVVPSRGLTPFKDTGEPSPTTGSRSPSPRLLAVVDNSRILTVLGSRLSTPCPVHSMDENDLFAQRSAASCGGPIHVYPASGHTVTCQVYPASRSPSPRTLDSTDRPPSNKLRDVVERKVLPSLPTPLQTPPASPLSPIQVNSPFASPELESKSILYAPNEALQRDLVRRKRLGYPRKFLWGAQAHDARVSGFGWSAAGTN